MARTPASHHDVLVVGSGFGGAVTALRLAEKGYRVAVLEAGRRFADHEFPETSWRLRDYLWAPWARCFGIFRLSPLRGLLVLSGAGVGGGSLVYANTLYRPPASFYADPQWAHVTDWAAELAPAYDQAERMLGVTPYPRVSPSDAVLRSVADEMGVGHTWRPAHVGVFFGDGPGAPATDPYFGGAGPERHGCRHCGECMTGCRHGAKNTLVKNYLHLAERAGAEIRERTTVRSLRPRDGDASGDSGYEVDVRRTGVPGGRERLHADQVVVAASALGTQRLLARARRRGDLPRVSSRLGALSRSNSEAILSARSRAADADFTEGVSITSSIHPDADTHVEPVRYGHGSNLLALMSAVMVDGSLAAADSSRGERAPSWRRVVAEVVRSRRDLLALHRPRRWAEQSIVLLVMQSLDNSLTLRPRRWLPGLSARRTAEDVAAGEPNPAWIPAGHDVARRVARRLRGIPVGAASSLVNMPVTGHFLGGAVISDAADRGVVDPYHRVHGHPGLHVVDGSTIPANLGVNPSLTITALAERAMSLWPRRGSPTRVRHPARPTPASSRWPRTPPSSRHTPPLPYGWPTRRPAPPPEPEALVTYPPEPWTLTGRMDASTFLVPEADLPALRPPEGHRPVLVGGRAVVTVAWVDYDTGGMMYYRELLATVAMRRGAAIRPHITDIWVDSPDSRDGGRGLWGIPKGLAVFDDAAPGDDPADGVRRCTPEGARYEVATATVRRGARLPARVPVRFAVVQHSEVAGRPGTDALVSPVATRTGIGAATLAWEFDRDGALGHLAGRRPVSSLALHDFGMLFGMTALDRSRART